MGGYFAAPISIIIRSNRVLGHRESFDEAFIVFVWVLIVVCWIGAVDAIVSGEQQLIPTETLNASLPFVWLVAMPGRFVEGVGWWLALNRTMRASPVLTSRMVLGLLAALVALLGTLYAMVGTIVLATVAILDLSISASRWLLIKGNRLYGGILPRISVLMILAGSTLASGNHTAGLIMLLVPFVAGVLFATRAMWVEAIADRLE